ncbi:hypothetical protein XENOCAPTIV_020879 [Xenoophorus captivus]|uniref:Uncharacterized protein n=1 Tax=Xenoophorus captivus TaxID=1517983 RepID=A0ABV0RSV5_9TELE
MSLLGLLGIVLKDKEYLWRSTVFSSRQVCGYFPPFTSSVIIAPWWRSNNDRVAESDRKERKIEKEGEYVLWAIGSDQRHLDDTEMEWSDPFGPTSKQHSFGQKIGTTVKRFSNSRAPSPHLSEQRGDI